jgi:hypothetical protein
MTSKFSSTSVATTLQSSITSTSATSMTVATGTGNALMGGVVLASGNVDKFTVAIDADTINEEIVFITTQTSDTMTIVRGQAGSSAVTHTAGASVKHVLTSYDLTNFQGTVSPVTTIGFSGSTSGTTTVQATAVAGTNTLTLPATTSDTLVGKATTDTLTNKTLTSPTINGATIGTSSINLTLNAQIGTSYSPILTDNGKLITISNAGTATLTVSPNSTTAFPTGAQVNIQRIGAGGVTIAAGSGVTINGTGTTLRAQWSAATLIKTDTDIWTLVGDLA